MVEAKVCEPMKLYSLNIQLMLFYYIHYRINQQEINTTTRILLQFQCASIPTIVTRTNYYVKKCRCVDLIRNLELLRSTSNYAVSSRRNTSQIYYLRSTMSRENSDAVIVLLKFNRSIEEIYYCYNPNLKLPLILPSALISNLAKVT